MAAAGLAATATACSHAAPAPVTPKDAGNAGPSGQHAGAGRPAATATHHSSEAEPKSASPTPTSPATPAAAPGAASAALTPPAAAGQAGAAPAASPGAVALLQPMVTTSASEAGTAAGAGAAAAGTASGPGKTAATPAASPQAPVVGAPAAAAAPTGAVGAPATSSALAGTAGPNPSVIVVDTADYDPDSQLTLAEAARAERERKADTVPPRIIINNKTIHRYAKGGQLTVAEPKKKAAPPPAAQAAALTTVASATTAASPTQPLQRDEKYWRGRALEIRQRWRKASDRIKELEDDIALLRRRFYAQDDPYVRDGQIKPAWDRALDELRESRATVQAAKKELTDFLDEGRIAGALPGWLREGVDLEPKEEKPVDPTQPIETPIYKDHGR
jgi:hypothetical protein